MQAFDPACANSLTYTKLAEDRGLNHDRIEQRVAEMYRAMKSMNAKYSRFDLDKPWTPFVARGLRQRSTPGGEEPAAEAEQRPPGE
jgi:hypothetical protein